jgi:hypothetical protein
MNKINEELNKMLNNDEIINSYIEDIKLLLNKEYLKNANITSPNKR